jgi:serine/threonine-protein kinase RsbW
MAQSPGRRIIELKFPSELGYEKVARETVESVARQMGFSPERVEDLKTAVGEACMNAIQHGNKMQVGMKVVIVLTAEDDKLDILVKDSGLGGKPPDEVELPDIKAKIEGNHEIRGGLGRFIIQNLVDESGFVEPDEEGRNQFRMVIYKLDSSAEATSAAGEEQAE